MSDLKRQGTSGRKALVMSDVKGAVQRTFNTPDGKLVMEWLSRTYYDCPIKSDEAVRSLGSRDVIHQLKRMTEE